MPTMQRNPAGGVIDPRMFGRGAGTVKPPMPVPGFEDGGTVYDEEDIEGQGMDDATLDPMSFVNGALNYGRKKYGLPADDEQEMGFEDGGVVPTAPEEEVTGGGNPNAIDPRQAMAYLSGDGAVSQEIAQALEQKVDPQGQLDPTQRAMAAIGVAPSDEARFGLLQHYRTKYNAYSGAAKAALAKGDMGGAAQYASMAMDSVPDGKRTQFAPAQGGLAMISKPSFNRRQQPQQQSFARGGMVRGYAPNGGEVEDDEAQDYATEAPQAAAPATSGSEPAAQAEPVVPDYAPEPVEDPQDTMPRQSAPPPAAPEVLPVQAVVQMLDDGFDERIKAARSTEPGTFQPAAPRPRAPMTSAWNPAPQSSEEVLQSYGGVVGKGEQPDVAAQMRVAAAPRPAGSEQRFASSGPPEAAPSDGFYQRAGKAIGGVYDRLQSFDSMRNNIRGPFGGRPFASQPVEGPVMPAYAAPYPDEYQPAGAGGKPVTAPVTAPVTEAAPPRRAMGRVAGSLQEPARPGAGAAQGVVPTVVRINPDGTRNPPEPIRRVGEPTYGAGRGAAAAPSSDPYDQRLAAVRARGQYAEYDPTKRMPDARGNDYRSFGRNPNGRTASMGPGQPGTEPPPPRRMGRTDITSGRQSMVDAPTYHPSGYDPNGAPAYGSQRVRGFGPGLREQTGDPAFMDPKFRQSGSQPVYPTQTARGRISADEAVAARAAQPDVGAPAGDRYGPGTPTRALDDRLGRARGALPVAGTAGGMSNAGGGRGVIPTGGRNNRDTEEDRYDRAMQRWEDEAARQFPAASQQGRRQDYIAWRAAEYEKTQREFGKEELRIDREDVRQRGQMDKQVQIDIEKERREAQRASDRIAEIELKARNAATENDKKRAATERKELVRATVDTALKGNATRAGILKQAMRDNVGKSAFELQKAISPYMKDFGLAETDALDAAKTLMGINPHTGVYGGGGGGGEGGAGMRPPSSVDAAAERKLNPGDTRYARGKDGTSVKYTVGPDGRWYDDKAYNEHFGRK